MMRGASGDEQEYNRPNGLSVEKAPKSDLYLFTFDFLYNFYLKDFSFLEELSGLLS